MPLTNEQGFTGGLGGASSRTKTAYDLQGNPVEVGLDIPLQQWQPGVGYAGRTYFEAPPPASGGGGARRTGSSSFPQSLTSLTGATQSTPLVQGQAIGGTRAGGISQESFEDERFQQQRITADTEGRDQSARLQAEAETRRLGFLSQISSTSPATVQHGGGVQGDEVAARSAAFARAKEQAGQTALASVKAIQDVMAGAGRQGSSVEGAALSSIIGGARSEVNDFTREQLLSDLSRSAQIADLEFQGGITQRGQDISTIPSLFSMLTSRGLAF